ncbi:THAP-type domain-containing protein [Nephila pilipes]|uniref:THAP-type domain-containing protein n=1 Tax=Nephila pilipes TaxID=299642 RepID=A0A8X6Q1V2_NEPPI|nr:THAP-type domain-containing protein [Nephila pilipes]
MRCYCCIPNCNSSSIDNEPGLSFHEFPSKIHYRNRWLKSITTLVTSDFRLNEKIKTKVCSKHFKETDFSPLCSKRRRLKGYAVPSVFPESINKLPESKVLELEIIIKRDSENVSRGNADSLGLLSPLCIEAAEIKDHNLQQIVSVDSEEFKNFDAETTDIGVCLETLDHKCSAVATCITSESDVTYENKDVRDVLKCEKNSRYDLSLNNSFDGLKKISAQESNLSEFTVFGLYVASQLQQLPLEDAYKLKEKIQTLLTQFCPQSLKEPSFFSYMPQNASNVTNNNFILDNKLFVSKEGKKIASYSSSQTYIPANINSSFKIYTLTQNDFLLNNKF